jgi:hypothetical protein
MQGCLWLILGTLVGLLLSFMVMWGSCGTALPLVTPPSAGGMAASVQKLVDNKVDALLASGLPLNNLPCPLPVDVGRILDTTPADPGYIFAYNFNGPHTGRLLYHGSDSGWCEDLSASCKVSSSTKLCKNMWGYHALNGQASVQEWVRIADAVRSGWVAYYWKENDGSDVIAPKYTYIKAVPGTDFFLAAGFTPST